MDFETLKLNPSIAACIKAMGYVEQTPIQAQALPPVLEGRDVLGQAQTGTGKTAVFVLPILQRLLNRQRGPVRALIIAPTRELAEQIHAAICQMGRKTGIRSATVYGGVGMKAQVDNLRGGTDIVVACPGRLLDHIEHRTVDLSQVEVLVLDEADRMLDMGFLPDIHRILRYLPKKRQTLLFSATLPGDIRRLAHDFMHEPVTVQIGHSAPVETVSHALYPVPQHLKSDLLIELLRHTDTRSVLVFTRTKHRAKRLGTQLEGAGFKATSLQGNLSQSRRQAAMDGFRSGAFQVLVATDIAARGIDVSTISHVINYDIPNTADAYTHRIGRTGRVDRTGDAFTLVAPDDESEVRTIERLIGSRIERRTLEGFDYNRSPPPKFSGEPHQQQIFRRRREQGFTRGSRQNGSRQDGGRRQGGWQDGRGHDGRRQQGGSQQGRPNHSWGNR
jgi:ATP-dependent RNA helicase RhlE